MKKAIWIMVLVQLFASAVCADPSSQSATATLRAGQIAWLRCAACHSVKPGEAHKLGPNLAGVVGAAAGRLAHYRYSDPLKKAAEAGLKWDTPTLRRWIENPAQAVPGTSMSYANTLNSNEIEALIAWMAAQK